MLQDNRHNWCTKPKNYNHNSPNQWHCRVLITLDSSSKQGTHTLTVIANETMLITADSFKPNCSSIYPTIPLLGGPTEIWHIPQKNWALFHSDVTSLRSCFYYEACRLVSQQPMHYLCAHLHHKSGNVHCFQVIYIYVGWLLLSATPMWNASTYISWLSIESRKKNLAQQSEIFLTCPSHYHNRA